MTSAIEASGLHKRYGELVAVDDVSFAVEAGEVFVLLGPNGAGKTTTLEILEGLRRPDAGSATVLGSPPGARERAQNVGVMLQDADLYAGIRTAEAVRLFASFYDEHENPEALINKLGLDRVRRTTYRRLSGGERRRLSLALALVGRPRVAFLDEPTAGMDIEGRATTWAIVRELCDRGTAVLLTTHLLDEAERVADRVAILRHGHIVAAGTPAELTSGANGRLTIETVSKIDIGDLGRAVDASVTPEGPRRYRVDFDGPPAAFVARLTRWLADNDVQLRRLDVGPRSLEDVYLELTR